MLAQLRDAVIASVRRRVEQGDCPTEPAHSVEMLENVILDLATPSQRLDAATVWRRAREAAAQVFDARARKAKHPESAALERHHAKVIRQDEGDDYDAVQAARIALLNLATEPHQHGGKGA